MKKRQFLTLLLCGTLAWSCAEQDGLLPDTNTLGVTRTESMTPSLLNDSLALVAFYDAMNGDQWPTGYNNWKKAPIRQWFGIKLEKIDGERRVTSIRLHNMNLNGQLPTELKNLTELRVLALSENKGITGSIIDEVYTLNKLQVLLLSFTNLTGTLSAQIGNLTELDSLDLRTSKWVLGGSSYAPNPTRMSGEIPQELGKLTKLRHLNFNRQPFSGNLPIEIGSLSNLRFLDVSECDLSGIVPASIGNLKKLQTLFGGSNRFNGTLPETISNMSSLEQLYLNNNALSGSIPSNIGAAGGGNIHDIDLSHNQLTGHIPTSLEKTSGLTLLYLNNNQLEGEIPAQLGNNPIICYVRVDNNNLTGSLPMLNYKYPAGPSQPGLCIMSVTNNRLTGEVPATMLHFSDYGKNLLPQQTGYGFSNFK